MTLWRWAFDDTSSDLSVPGDNFDKRMLVYPSAAGEITIEVDFDSTETDFFFSPQNQPGDTTWPIGVWYVGIDVVQANSKITWLSAIVQRIRDDGTFVENYGQDISGAVPLGSTGPKVRSGPTLPQTPPIYPSDRVRLRMQWQRNNFLGGDGIFKIGYGDSLFDYCEVPIIMAAPRIVWNGNDLNFPGSLTGYDARQRARRFLDFSDGQVPRASLRSRYDFARIQLANFDDADFEQELQNWWTWAVQGNSYGFALDSGDMVDTTLNGAANAGQKVIPLTATAGVSVDQRYRLRQAIGHEEEIVYVASISAGVSVTARDNLKISFASGDVFRSRDYYPAMVAIGEETPIIELPGQLYMLDHSMREDRS